MIKAIIVDDSRLARGELRHLLKPHTEIKIIAEAQDAFEAQDLIDSLCPDLVFLDIQMPGKNGLEMLAELTHCPQVIFTTAYDQYAIQAFEVNALDYLLKPIKASRLTAALDKLTVPEQQSEPTQLLGVNDQVFVKDGDNCWFVKLAEIRLLEIEGNYTKVYFDQHRPMIAKSLNYLDERLDKTVFFRANRSQIINLLWVEKVEPWLSGLLVTLKNGDTIEISRRQSQQLKDLMSF